jgi:transcriptional regulator with XRE-family HTH domain
MEKNILGKRLRTLRESTKLSQLRLAAVNGNMAQPAVNRYENGNASPSLETLLWYADYFDISMDYIFGRTDDPRGRLFDCKSRYVEDNKELKEFVEMLFDPNAPINTRLKEAILKMLEDGKKDERQK